MKIGNTTLKELLKPTTTSKIQEKRSDTTGRLLCSCGKGYASEDKEGEHYGKCKVCWVRSLTRREMKEKGIKHRL